MSIPDLKTIRALARQWRLNNPGHEAGIVLVWEGTVYGWKNCIRDAHHERPGVMAVDASEAVFVAEGGDDYNGAKGWVLLQGPGPGPGRNSKSCVAI